MNELTAIQAFILNEAWNAFEAQEKAKSTKSLQ